MSAQGCLKNQHKTSAAKQAYLHVEGMLQQNAQLMWGVKNEVIAPVSRFGYSNLNPNLRFKLKKTL
jgi:hypothetical protein